MTNANPSDLVHSTIHRTDTGLTGRAPMFSDILALHGKWRANKPALVDNGQPISWAELDASANQVANALLASGRTKGDVIALLMQNGREMVEGLLGIAKAGMVSAPLNLSVTDEAIEAMIKDADAKGILTSSDQAIRLCSNKTIMELPLKVTCESNREIENWMNWGDWLKEQSQQAPDCRLEPGDPFNIIYSSGTTGQPKGIVHTQQTRLDWAYDLSIALRYHGNSRTLCTLNLYSNIAWVQMMCTWLAGGTLYLLRNFDAGDVLTQIETHKISHTAMVPVQFQRLLDHKSAAQTDLSSMQAMMSCGSPLHEELKARIFDRFSCGIIELYGLTEGVITTLEPEEIEGRLASVGRPLIGTDLCLLDDNDQLCPIGQAGEILSRGRIVMPGYHNRSDANQQCTWIDPQGRAWLRTGDIGKLDAEGYLYIVDRKKDMILSGGQNIYPADIEAVLVEHAQVRDAAIIGIPSKDWGETPIAWVEPKADTKPDTDEIMEWLNQRVGKRQRIRAVYLIDTLPRNPNGKVLKRELRDISTAG
ncbi:MAG: long-chain fatty acid--CoA ligase [Robiginitomaculum sp.]|nr:MAG: long-chain fatty acid--CoA ligase [Robiginitomaculum sp.]